MPIRFAVVAHCSSVSRELAHRQQRWREGRLKISLRSEGACDGVEQAFGRDVTPKRAHRAVRGFEFLRFVIVRNDDDGKMRREFMQRVERFRVEAESPRAEDDEMQAVLRRVVQHIHRVPARRDFVTGTMQQKHCALGEFLVVVTNHNLRHQGYTLSLIYRSLPLG